VRAAHRRGAHRLGSSRSSPPAVVAPRVDPGRQNPRRRRECRRSAARALRRLSAKIVSRLRFAERRDSGQLEIRGEELSALVERRIAKHRHGADEQLREAFARNPPRPCTASSALRPPSSGRRSRRAWAYSAISSWSAGCPSASLSPACRYDATDHSTRTGAAEVLVSRPAIVA